jgi:hypothetical protein
VDEASDAVSDADDDGFGDRDSGAIRAYRARRGLGASYFFYLYLLAYLFILFCRL